VGPAGLQFAHEVDWQLTAIIERQAASYVALCPELDIASQGDTVEAARTNLIEALELFFESAEPTEVARRPQRSSSPDQLHTQTEHRLFDEHI
jgi:predicted RNase H-like HicB family nuclease